VMRTSLPIRHHARVTDATSSAPVEKLFLSFAGPDRGWAEWAAFHLREAGYEVEIDTDWGTGDNFVLRMNSALEGRNRVICLYSGEYFAPKRFTWDEWTSVMSDRNRAGRLIPLRLEKVEPPAILRPLIYKDLFDLDEDATRVALLEAITGRKRSTEPPPFPPSR
jgi:hypothetical protein